MPNEHSGATFPNGAGLYCTGFALEIQEKLGDRVAVYGFFAEDNPGTVWDRLANGHDFAVIDDRFIVDPWVSDMEQEGQGVYDLEDDDDTAEIARLYGARANWDVVSPAPTPGRPGP
ncbi:hypothetical protein Salmuc_01362 [Salipiger mucosus DSM 16094]|uniref:Uncharacterized protein n=1 Tax=Salipiger mucosus DSM 16094 TaxID=1123237 RepID=S9SES6_9RHOB|nr:hypothetical protein Salmuc_01362 [Salipiger mucosus DSM 16094]